MAKPSEGHNKVPILNFVTSFFSIRTSYGLNYLYVLQNYVMSQFFLFFFTV